MRIVEPPKLARDMEVGAVFEHQGSLHMRISDPDAECRHVPAVQLATGQYVLVPNAIDVKPRPDAHIVTDYPACDPACDPASRTVGPLQDPDDFMYVNGLGYYRQE